MHAEEERKKKKKSVKTMTSYASNRHHRWSTQAAWTNKKLRKNSSLTLCRVSNNGQLCSQTPPRVVHANRLDQFPWNGHPLAFLPNETLIRKKEYTQIVYSF